MSDLDEIVPAPLDDKPEPDPASASTLDEDVIWEEPIPSAADQLGHRLCNKIGCKRALCSFERDPHHTCVDCRGICTVEQRCNECRKWPAYLLQRCSKWQISLQKKRVAKRAKRLSLSAAPVVSDVSISQDIVSSLAPSDSASSKYSTVSKTKFFKLQSEVAGIKDMLLDAQSPFIQMITSALTRSLAAPSPLAGEPKSVSPGSRPPQWPPVGPEEAEKGYRRRRVSLPVPAVLTLRRWVGRVWVRLLRL